MFFHPDSLYSLRPNWREWYWLFQLPFRIFFGRKTGGDVSVKVSPTVSFKWETLWAFTRINQPSCPYSWLKRSLWKLWQKLKLKRAIQLVNFLYDLHCPELLTLWGLLEPSLRTNLLDQTDLNEGESNKSLFSPHFHGKTQLDCWGILFEGFSSSLAAWRRKR